MVPKHEGGMANYAMVPEPRLTPRRRRPMTHLSPVIRGDGGHGWLEVDEAGPAANRHGHPPRAIDELIGPWGTSDKRWEV
jgi:hypothetical protein